MPTDSTVQDLNELYTKARSARAVLEPVWQMNMAYFANEAFHVKIFQDTANDCVSK